MPYCYEITKAHCSHSISKTKLRTFVYWPRVLLTCNVFASGYHHQANMAAWIRKPDWQKDTELKQDLKQYALQNLSWRDIRLCVMGLYQVCLG